MSPNAPFLPGWQYKNYADWDSKLVQRVDELFQRAILPSFDYISASQDTRSTHAFLFHDLTGPGEEANAGHYRGENFDCLRLCRCFVGGFEGAPPEQVHERMKGLRTLIRTRVRVLVEYAPNLSATDFFASLVSVVAEIFHTFLKIHPYSDGNGHLARQIVVNLFVPHGHLPIQWSVHPRPFHEVEYLNAIRSYDIGDPKPLIGLMLQWFS